jgi:C-terminal processing protease CtpA/Prc
MVLGAGPILGDGQAGAYLYPDGRRVPWSYMDGTYLSDQVSTRSVPEPYHLKQTMPPVAVLTSRSTASAGEQTLISFRGREGVRSFGEPTYGVPNAAVGKILGDGALINLAGALMADRTGYVYPYNERIAPDQEVATEQNFARVGTDDDRVVQAATQWLKSQGSCAQSNP